MNTTNNMPSENPAQGADIPTQGTSILQQLQKFLIQEPDILNQCHNVVKKLNNTYFEVARCRLLLAVPTANTLKAVINNAMVKMSYNTAKNLCKRVLQYGFDGINNKYVPGGKSPFHNEYMASFFNALIRTQPNKYAQSLNSTYASEWCIRHAFRAKYAKNKDKLIELHSPEDEQERLELTSKLRISTRWTESLLGGVLGLSPSCINRYMRRHGSGFLACFAACFAACLAGRSKSLGAMYLRNSLNLDFICSEAVKLLPIKASTCTGAKVGTSTGADVWLNSSKELVLFAE